jgi:methionine-S-sulfoxide reductase
MQDKADHSKRKATFAGGCFWCMQPAFVPLRGVVATMPGDTGVHKKNPTYQEVCAGDSGHSEALQIIFDPAKISSAKRLDVFWKNITPADADGQFVDRGSQYRPAIFFPDEEQHRLAEDSREKLARSGIFESLIMVEMTPAGDFYPAVAYYQNFYQKSPLRYKSYRDNSGRAQFLQKIRGEEN